MVRLGVLGLGGMGTLHAVNACSVAGARLVAVASTRPNRAREVALQLAVEPRSYEALIGGDDVDAVVVAARSVDHATVARDVLRAGKHLFLEKPGATTLLGHDELVEEAARHRHAVIQVGYHRRYDAQFVEAARLVSDGAIGEPLLVVGTSRDIRTPEPEDPGPAGGFLLDMASHDYDAACWFLGQEPVEVSASRQAAVYPELLELGDLDNALVTIRFDGGGLASTHVSRTCVFGHDIRVEVVGTEGSVLVGNSASREGVSIVRAGDSEAFPEDYRKRFADAYRKELEAFVAACTGDGPVGPGLTEDRRAVAIGIAARASAVGGAPLDVGQDWRWP